MCPLDDRVKQRQGQCRKGCIVRNKMSFWRWRSLKNMGGAVSPWNAAWTLNSKASAAQGICLGQQWVFWGVNGDRSRFQTSSFLPALLSHSSTVSRAGGQLWDGMQGWPGGCGCCWKPCGLLLELGLLRLHRLLQPPQKPLDCVNTSFNTSLKQL